MSKLHPYIAIAVIIIGLSIIAASAIVILQNQKFCVRVSDVVYCIGRDAPPTQLRPLEEG